MPGKVEAGGRARTTHAVIRGLRAPDGWSSLVSVAQRVHLVPPGIFTAQAPMTTFPCSVDGTPHRRWILSGRRGDNGAGSGGTINLRSLAA